MDLNKDSDFIKKLNNSHDIKLYRLIPYFPWEEWCNSQDFAMPYPEIIALSDYAHAMYTQITGLLIDYTSSPSNYIRVNLKNINGDVSDFLICVDVVMNEVSEIWECIGINNEDLRRYTSFMVRNYLAKEVFSDSDYTIEQIDDFTYKLKFFNNLQ